MTIIYLSRLCLGPPNHFNIILSDYSSKVVQLVGTQAIPILATMILLSYTKLTLMMLLCTAVSV